MRLFVDWLSFTFPFPKLAFDTASIHERHASSRLISEIGADDFRLLFGADYELGNGRFPYQYQIRGVETGAVLMYHRDLPHALVECPGRACSTLIANQRMDEVVERVYGSLSRIDVSADILCDVSPTEFVELRSNSTIRTRGTFASDSGYTEYLGSAKSDRFVCCYRFNPPHPRAQYLRVEHRFRRDYAKQMGQLLSSRGLAASLAHCQQIYGWEHPLWDLGKVDPFEVPRIGVTRQEGNRLRWLVTQVVPCLRNMERDGTVVDMHGFLAEHLWPSHNDTI